LVASFTSSRSSASRSIFPAAATASAKRAAPLRRGCHYAALAAFDHGDEVVGTELAVVGDEGRDFREIAKAGGVDHSRFGTSRNEAAEKDEQNERRESQDASGSRATSATNMYPCDGTVTMGRSVDERWLKFPAQAPNQDIDNAEVVARSALWPKPRGDLLARDDLVRRRGKEGQGFELGGGERYVIAAAIAEAALRQVEREVADVPHRDRAQAGPRFAASSTVTAGARQLQCEVLDPQSQLASVNRLRQIFDRPELESP
jgi:hypothetical protein